MKKKLMLATMAVISSLCVSACGNDVIIDVVTNEAGAATVAGAEAGDSKEEVSEKVEVAKVDVPDTNPAGMPTIAVEDLKIGVLYIGSSADTSGYTYAHELGIQGMMANLGLKEDQVVRKDDINDGDTVAVNKALQECIDDGCNIIFTTSWGYMDETAEFAEKYPDIYFAHGTGYMSNGSNFTNYFGRIYQARYLSGLVAGLKTESNKVGYVSAMGTDNSECTGGIDAFAIGVEQVNPDATVYVAVTNSWFDPEKEQAASDALIAQGCDVLAQHVDTTAPQTTSEANGTWAIGYNSDMSKETPNATLTSVIWNWSAYYTSYVSSIVSATYDGSNYYSGMDENLVNLTAISSICADGSQDIVNKEMSAIMSGSKDVFFGTFETNTGDIVGEDGKMFDDATITGGINWYYKNVQQINF